MTRPRRAGRGLRAGHEVELADEFLVVAARWRGFGGRGWQECVQLDQGYAPVVSTVDSTGASKIMPTAELSPQANFPHPGLVGGVSEGGSDTNAKS